jgi:PBP1b-binding outer membrane lipoprotein LpoB
MNSITHTSLHVFLRSFALIAIASVLMILSTGCASAVSAGTNTSLNGDDLIAMTDKMSMSILASPGVQQAIAKDHRLKVVIQPVENYMTGEILPSGQKQTFVARVRELLAAHAPNQFQWIMNKSDYYAVRAKELETRDLGPNPDSLQPAYALTARFDSLGNESSKVRTEGYLCTYQLTDLRTRETLWTDKYEVKKTAVKGFLD